MSVAPRKRSPRAPSAALEEALDRAIKLYDRERRHPVPADIAANAMGYKGASNGAAATMIATLRYYGLLDRPEEGKLQVSPDVERYKFNPSDEDRRQLRIKWLKSPSIFSELLEKYQSSLPSDDTLRFELIQRGFTPESASDCAIAFRRSVDWSDYFSAAVGQEVADVPHDSTLLLADPTNLTAADADRRPEARDQAEPYPNQPTDRIPIRLPGGRRAWIEVPVPLYEADKTRIKAQIDLLLTDE